MHDRKQCLTGARERSIVGTVPESRILRRACASASAESYYGRAVGIAARLATRFPNTCRPCGLHALSQCVRLPGIDSSFEAD